MGKRFATVLAAVAVAAGVGACGGSSPAHEHSGPSGTSTVHNAQDVAFAHNMIPHHQQAVDMSAMVPRNSTNHDLIVLAKHISLDQQSEIEIMQGLLAHWGASGAHDHQGHGGQMRMEGMVDSATMNRLQSLTGADFDTLWLRSMIKHHQGAVSMARMEIARGQNPDAVKLAKIIVDAQQWEIARMTDILSTPI
jgi:uncharacterized protein (DUF305 family)